MNWGKVIRGKPAIVEFSNGHLVGTKVNYEIERTESTSEGELYDGVWKSSSFEGPTRFIFTLNPDQTKIKKLVISSPRWFDRLFNACRFDFSMA